MANTRTWTITQSGQSRAFSINTGVGPRGPQGPDPTIEGVVTRGAILSINADPTKFDVAAGSGYLDGTLIEWEAQAGITCTNLATATRTYVSISSAGAVVQSTSKPTPESRRANLFIGQLGHTSNTSIATALTAPDTSLDTNLSLNDLLRCIGPIPCDGNRVSANGANLSINIDAGYLLGSGANHEDADGTSGVQKYFAALTAPTFRHRTSTGEGSSSSTLDVGFYDNGGTRTAVSGTRAQNFRVYRLLSGNIVIQYGPTTYTSISNAINGFADETFTTFGNITEIGALVGVIAVKANATDLSDTTQAQFYTPTALGRASSAAQLNETNLASVFTGATSKTTPVDADEIPLVDSAASYGLKKLTWANLKATLKTYFDTLYGLLTGNNTWSGTNTFNSSVILGADITAGAGAWDGASFTGPQAFESVTMSGDLTVDTTTLKVDSTNNRVGIGTASPSYPLDIAISDGAYSMQIPNGVYIGQKNSGGTISAILGANSGDLLYLGGSLWGACVFQNNFAEQGRVDADGLQLASGNTVRFASNSGTWDGATFAGNQTFSGQVSFTGMPKVSAYKSSDQTGLTTGAYNKITFDTEEYDLGSNFASSTFTAPYACKVLVNVSILASGTAGADALAVYKNGSQHKRLINKTVESAEVINGSVVVDCATSDTLDIYYYAQNARSILGASTITWVQFTVIA